MFRDLVMDMLTLALTFLVAFSSLSYSGILIDGGHISPLDAYSILLSFLLSTV